jgi:hypothetical protein
LTLSAPVRVHAVARYLPKAAAYDGADIKIFIGTRGGGYWVASYTPLLNLLLFSTSFTQILFRLELVTIFLKNVVGIF